MPPKNKNKRKNQGKRKNSQQGSSQASSPSNKAASPANTSTTATSSTVEQELITPGAFDLRLSNPGLAAVDEDSSLATPTASDVMSDDVTSPDPNTDDVEYQEDDGMKTPTAEVPMSAMKGASAAAAAAATSASTRNSTEAPTASHAQRAAEVPAAPPSPSRSETPKNPFRDDKSESTVDTALPKQTQQTTIVEETTFDEVPLGPSDSSTGPAAAPASLAGPHRAMDSDEVPTLKAVGPTDSVGTPAPATTGSLASPHRPHETVTPFLNPGTPLVEESLQEYRSRTHIGYDKPRPSEPFMQMDAAPDAAPTDNFVSNGGANQAATAEPQNVWAPGQQGFERSEHAPSTTVSIAMNNLWLRDTLN